MFEKIIELMKNNNYEEAIKKLSPFLTCNDPEVTAYANYLLGYSYYYKDNREKNKWRIKYYIQNNINSEFPCPNAYVLYSKIETDNNIAINYLLKGIYIYPNETQLYMELLCLSQDKEEIVRKIQEKGFTEYELLKKVIEYLIKNKQWLEIEKAIIKIQKNNSIDEYDNNYLELLKAYSFLFREKPNFKIAIEIFKLVIEKDINNNLRYSHYLGMIYALIKLERVPDAINFFDRLPINNSISDLFEGSGYIIEVWFDEEYKEIFNCIYNIFEKDLFRNNRARCLYVLYLYYPSDYEKYRFKKSDLKVLEKYLKTEFNKIVAAALFNMYCYYEQFIEANNLYLKFLENDNPEEFDIFYDDIIVRANNEVLNEIVNEIVLQIRTNENINTKVYVDTMFNYVVKRLFDDKQFSMIVSLADQLSINDLLMSEVTFECAYSYGKENDDKCREQILYEKIVSKEPDNCAAINNLGIIFENNKAYEKAQQYYSRALKIASENEKYKNNLLRINHKIETINEKKRKEKNQEIRKIAKDINLDFFEQIGYTDDLIALFQRLKDNKMKDILLRDLKECAICIATKQSKSATIMCGSIIEALLLTKITESGNLNYDISEISKNRKAVNFPVSDMGLNELLYVADKEKLICKNNYHLSHYARDYRNVVHPAKEIRVQQNVTQDNAMVMWSILKQIILELLGN